MANRHKVQAFRSGGVPKLASGNSARAAAGMKGGTNPGIKPIQKKDGGKVEGKKDGGRLDKRARGGAIGKFARGGSPFSSAAKAVKG
jgi:hypothetical protein